MADRDPVLDIIAQAQVALERADAESAQGWAVLVHDDEHGSDTIYGPFATEMAAAVWGDAHSRAIHLGHPEGEPGWTVSVRPILPFE